MKALIFALLLTPTLSWAAPFVCFSDIPAAAANDGEVLVHMAAWNPSCESMQRLGTGLNATSLVISGVGLGLACTGVGIPATLWLEGGALGIQVVSVIVGQLPCDNSARDEQIKEMAGQIVCEELRKQGMGCSRTL